MLRPTGRPARCWAALIANGLYRARWLHGAAFERVVMVDGRAVFGLTPDSLNPRWSFIDLSPRWLPYAGLVSWTRGVWA